ncbi:MAG: CBS domain-containing protein [Nitrospirae bacterium]|nr:MAG: CBS domain-containing protein [Nitrospirota bacterium]
MDIIVTHLNADFDALASMMAAKKLYPEAEVVFPGSVEKRVRDFIEAYKPLEIKRLRDIRFDKVKRLIVTDTRHIDKAEQLKAVIADPKVKVHIYDHHPPTPNDIRGELEVIENVGAAATIFTEIFQKKKTYLTPMEATVLCLGIYEETGSLVFPSTTPRDLMAVAYLLRRGANLNIVASFLTSEMSREEFALMNELTQSLREVVIDGIRIKIAKGSLEGYGDVAHLAHKIMDMKDTDAAFLFIGISDKILIVGRSRVPELSSSEVLSDFGGGGHASAASATIKESPFEIVEERLIVSIHKHMKKQKTARGVMTSPVVVIAFDKPVREAEDMMTRYSVNVLPLVKKGKYAGIITREVVEKALFHGFGKSRCIDFASTDAHTVAVDTPAPEIETLMIEHNQRFVPVLEGDSVIGAITRTDIMRSLYENFLRRSGISSQEPHEVKSSAVFGKNIAALVRERMPESLFDFLRTAGAAADNLGISVYLVGGCVRDLLRGDENLDIDIVAEGDGISFAKELGMRFNAKVTVHQRFGTAQLLIRNCQWMGGRQGRVDVATSRTEYYESPAALPKVETSSIKKDLYRRDFTINTLAVKLNKNDFGRLIDFFGGQRDLKDKAIRVLHNLSFVEDPTRAFRAIRFSERFGFRITRHTENLIKTAYKMDIFEKLSGARIYDELMLIFSETNPLKAMKRLDGYNLLKVINPMLAFGQQAEALFQSVHDTLSWFDLLFLGETYDSGLIYLMALLQPLSVAERKNALARLAVPPKPAEKIEAGLSDASAAIKKLKADSPVEIYRMLISRPLESVLFIMAASDKKQKKGVSHFLLELRKTRPLLNGKELKALGLPEGPVYSVIFDRLLEERLRGRITTKEDEIEFLKKHKFFL